MKKIDLISGLSNAMFNEENHFVIKIVAVRNLVTILWGLRVEDVLFVIIDQHFFSSF